MSKGYVEDPGVGEADPGKALTLRQQRILSAWYDRESGAISGWLARRLLSHNPTARRFIADLGRISELSRESLSPDGETPDLWMSINRRIAEEERTEVILGKRQLGHTGTVAAALKAFAASPLGLTAAAALALVAVTVSLGGRHTGSPELQVASRLPRVISQAGTGIPVNFNTAGGNADADGDDPAYYSVFPTREPAHPFSRNLEIDWVKSRGRVNVIRNAKDRTAIFWITRERLPERSAPAISDRVPAAINVSQR